MLSSIAYATNSLGQVQNPTILCLSGSELKIVLTFLVLFVSRQKEQNFSNETASIRNKATKPAMRKRTSIKKKARK